MHVSNSATDAWIDILENVYDNGVLMSPRGIDTSEVLFVSHSFDMNRPIAYHQDRRLNYAFSAAEAYFIAHGDNRVANLAQYNKNIAQFSDDGLIFNGSYGPPFCEQVMYVVNTLADDLRSRQAVLTIWKPNPILSVDRMCTIALQFLVRENAMHTKVTMRSNDVWLGTPYDFFNFTIMTLRILTLLNHKLKSEIGLGILNWSAGSVHTYEHDKEKVAQVLGALPNKTSAKVPVRCYTDWNYVVDSLIACRDKDESSIVKNNLWRIRP